MNSMGKQKRVKGQTDVVAVFRKAQECLGSYIDELMKMQLTLELFDHERLNFEDAQERAERDFKYLQKVINERKLKLPEEKR
jgi:hypothetical protein